MNSTWQGSVVHGGRYNNPRGRHERGGKLYIWCLGAHLHRLYTSCKGLLLFLSSSDSLVIRIPFLYISIIDRRAYIAHWSFFFPFSTFSFCCLSCTHYDLSSLQFRSGLGFFIMASFSSHYRYGLGGYTIVCIGLRWYTDNKHVCVCGYRGFDDLE